MAAAEMGHTLRLILLRLLESGSLRPRGDVDSASRFEGYMIAFDSRHNALTLIDDKRLLPRRKQGDWVVSIWRIRECADTDKQRDRELDKIVEGAASLGMVVVPDTALLM
jgi:hypothetical protein